MAIVFPFLFFFSYVTIWSFIYLSTRSMVSSKQPILTKFFVDTKVGGGCSKLTKIYVLDELVLLHSLSNTLLSEYWGLFDVMYELLVEEPNIQRAQ